MATKKFIAGNRVGHEWHKHTGGREAPWRGVITLVSPKADKPYRVHWDHGETGWYTADKLFIVK